MVAARNDDRNNPYVTRSLSVVPINARAMIQSWLGAAKIGPHADPWRDMALAEDFATLWYGMRAAGREVRARAVAQLNQSPHFTRKGSLYPDPEEMQPWSEYDLIGTAANLLSVRLVQAPPTYASVIDAHEPEMAGQRLAWFLTQADTPYPALMWRKPQGANLYFQMAGLLGIMYRERARFTGQPQPGVFHILPSAKEAADLLSLAHQFAKALLLRAPDCPEQWGCLCNQIHALYNMTPPEHPVATDALQVRTIAASGPMQAQMQAHWQQQQQQRHHLSSPDLGNPGNHTGPSGRPPHGPPSDPSLGGSPR